jgi:hypothetical protein
VLLQSEPDHLRVAERLGDGKLHGFEDDRPDGFAHGVGDGSVQGVVESIQDAVEAVDLLCQGLARRGAVIGRCGHGVLRGLGEWVNGSGPQPWEAAAW